MRFIFLSGSQYALGQIAISMTVACRLFLLEREKQFAII